MARTSCRRASGGRMLARRLCSSALTCRQRRFAERAVRSDMDDVGPISGCLGLLSWSRQPCAVSAQRCWHEESGLPHLFWSIAIHLACGETRSISLKKGARELGALLIDECSGWRSMIKQCADNQFEGSQLPASNAGTSRSILRMSAGTVQNRLRCFSCQHRSSSRPEQANQHRIRRSGLHAGNRLRS